MQPFCVRRACIDYEQLYEFQISFSQPMQPVKMTLDRYIFRIWPAWLPIDETENLPLGPSMAQDNIAKRDAGG
jgi:hypothetical protein